MTRRKDTNAKKTSTKLKARQRAEPETRGTEAKTYKLPISVIRDIRKAATLYGSQGRAVQVGSELLVRLAKPLFVEPTNEDTAGRKTYKLAPRTIEIIQWLSETAYEDAGQVLTACIKALKLKNLG